MLDVALVALAGLGWKLSSVVFGERREKCVLTDDMSVIRAAWALRSEERRVGKECA